MFGLTIEARHEASFNMSVLQRSKVEALFEFDVDEYLTMTTLFQDMLGIDFGSIAGWREPEWSAFQ